MKKPGNILYNKKLWLGNWCRFGEDLKLYGLYPLKEERLMQAGFYFKQHNPGS